MRIIAKLPWDSRYPCSPAKQITMEKPNDVHAYNNEINGGTHIRHAYTYTHTHTHTHTRITDIHTALYNITHYTHTHLLRLQE